MAFEDSLDAPAVKGRLRARQWRVCASKLRLQHVQGRCKATSMRGMAVQPPTRCLVWEGAAFSSLLEACDLRWKAGVTSPPQTAVMGLTS